MYTIMFQFIDINGADSNCTTDYMYTIMFQFIDINGADSNCTTDYMYTIMFQFIDINGADSTAPLIICIQSCFSLSISMVLTALHH